MCMEQIDPKANYTGQKMIDHGIFQFKDGQERERRKVVKLVGDMKKAIEVLARHFLAHQRASVQAVMPQEVVESIESVEGVKIARVLVRAEAYEKGE